MPSCLTNSYRYYHVIIWLHNPWGKWVSFTFSGVLHHFLLPLEYSLDLVIQRNGPVRRNGPNIKQPPFLYYWPRPITTIFLLLLREFFRKVLICKECVSPVIHILYYCTPPLLVLLHALLNEVLSTIDLIELPYHSYCSLPFHGPQAYSLGNLFIACPSWSSL